MRDPVYAQGVRVMDDGDELSGAAHKQGSWFPRDRWRTSPGRRCASRRGATTERWTPCDAAGRSPDAARSIHHVTYTRVFTVFFHCGVLSGGCGCASAEDYDEALDTVMLPAALQTQPVKFTIVAYTFTAPRAYQGMPEIRAEAQPPPARSQLALGSSTEATPVLQRSLVLGRPGVPSHPGARPVHGDERARGPLRRHRLQHRVQPEQMVLSAACTRLVHEVG